MTALGWALTGAGVYLAAGLLIAAIVEQEVREALLTILFAPVGLVLAVIATLVHLLPKTGRKRAAGIRDELNDDRFERIAWGAGGRSWAVVVVRRTRKTEPAA